MLLLECILSLSYKGLCWRENGVILWIPEKYLMLLLSEKNTVLIRPNGCFSLKSVFEILHEKSIFGFLKSYIKAVIASNWHTVFIVYFMVSCALTLKYKVLYLSPCIY